MPAAAHADSLALYRREAAVLPALPSAVAPRVVATIDDDDGFALVLAVVEGTHPPTPWDLDSLRAVARALQTVAETEAPHDLPDAGDDMSSDLMRWHDIATDEMLRAGLPHGLGGRLPALIEIEQQLPAAVGGRMLIHGDLRADNILLADDRARFIDWPYAVRGAAWFDLPSLLPSVEAGGGPSCEVAWTVFEEFGAPQPDKHLPLIAGIASYFWFAQAQPEPLGVPGLRAFQRAQAVPALRWLSSLL